MFSFNHKDTRKVRFANLPPSQSLKYIWVYSLKRMRITRNVKHDDLYNNQKIDSTNISSSYSRKHIQSLINVLLFKINKNLKTGKSENCQNLLTSNNLKTKIVEKFKLY